jgi:DivIVA domain-containing protein
VELDRKSVEKQDFSASRRGYDPVEVDAHLSAIADAVEELKRASTAGTAAERVKGIIEAAEQSAAEIESAAREKAGTAGQELAAAERRRDEAEAEANEQLRRAEEASSLLEQAVAELERVRTALAALPKAPPLDAPTPMTEPRSASRAQTTILDDAVPPERVPEPEPETSADTEPAPAAAHGEPAPVEAAPESPAEAAFEAAAGASAGGEGARLIALNMALRGAPREETARYLAENFELDDPDALLDDVYSRAGG